MLGFALVRPMAWRLTVRAAVMYCSRNAGETRSTAAMLSKPSLDTSFGSSVFTSTSSAEHAVDLARVLGAVQAMQADIARIGIRRGGRIERLFHPANEVVERRLIRLRLARRGHQPTAQFAYGLLPHLRVGRDVVGGHGVECDAARPVGAVVALGAVLLEQAPVAGVAAGGGGWGATFSSAEVAGLPSTTRPAAASSVSVRDIRCDTQSESAVPSARVTATGTMLDLRSSCFGILPRSPAQFDPARGGWPVCGGSLFTKYTHSFARIGERLLPLWLS